MAIVVEVLARNNSVLHRHFINKDQINIGRAFDNDVHLDDPYVCAHHISLRKHEQCVEIEDKSSVNGLKINGKRSQIDNLGNQDIVTVGRTRLRIFPAAREIPKTIKLSELEEKIEWLSNPKVCVVLLLLLATAMGLGQYLHTFTEVKYGQIVESITKLLLFVCLWPLMFSFVSKLNKKDGRIISQFSLVFLAMLGFELLGYLATVLVVNSSAILFVDIINKLAQLALFFALLWFSLFIGFHQSTSARNKISLSVTIVAFIALILPDYLKMGDFTNRPIYNSTVLPPSLLWTSKVSTDEFVKQSESIFISTPKQVKQEN